MHLIHLDIVNSPFLEEETSRNVTLFADINE